MELLDRVILEDFGVVIDGNVEVDFEGFLAAISKLAPLDVELNAAEASILNTNLLDGTLDEGYLNGPLKEGVNSLSAGQLWSTPVAPARTRQFWIMKNERSAG